MAKLTDINNSVSLFSEFLPVVLNYLNTSWEDFTASQVAANFATWASLTNDKAVLSDILGSDIEYTTTSVQQRLPTQRFSKQESPVVKQEICKLVQKGVISKATYTPGQIVSNIVLRPKKDRLFRLILNEKV